MKKSSFHSNLNKAILYFRSNLYRINPLKVKLLPLGINRRSYWESSLLGSDIE
jgi:hypothetical protein